MASVPTLFRDLNQPGFILIYLGWAFLKIVLLGIIK
jgi:hypothetical protein